MQSKRRMIVGWRQIPVQKLRTRVGRGAAVPAAGAAAEPRAEVDPDDEAGEVPSPVPPRAK